MDRIALSLYRPAQPDRLFLLAADVDGTLLGDTAGELSLMAYARRFPRSFQLAVITGRRPASVRELVDAGRLPRPDFICGAVGTELLDCRGGANTLGGRYDAQVPVNWDVEIIYALGTGDGIRPQEFPEDRPRFQAGFDWDGRPESLAAFRGRVSNLAGCKILPSNGRFIDVLPDAMGKGGAVRFLQRELGLSPAAVIVAGDSGNDCEMFETGFRGILPSNALADLSLAASRPWHYRSPFPAASGVMDGLRHFGFVEPDGDGLRR